MALKSARRAIIDALHDSGLSQRQLAERMRVSEARVSLLLRPNANPTIKTLERIAAALNCKLSVSIERNQEEDTSAQA